MRQPIPRSLTARTNKSATLPSKANAQPPTIVTAVHAADRVHVATATHDTIRARNAIVAHTVIPAHAARAARLVEKEKAKTGDKIPPPHRPDEPLPANTKKLSYSHPGSLVPSFPEFNETAPISLLTRAQALTHLKLLPARTPPTVLSDDQLASLLRKTQLGTSDRANHNTVCTHLQEIYDAADRIGIEMYQGMGQPTTYINVAGDPIPPDQHDEILYKYRLPAEKDRYLLGNCWWIVC